MLLYSVAFCFIGVALINTTVAFNTRECMEACANCATFYGRDLYDVRSCLGSCQQSSGDTTDPQCANELYHFVKRSGQASSPEKRSPQIHLCIQHCGTCVMLWTKEVYDGMRCVQQCKASGGKRSDPECRDPANSRLSLKGKKV